MKDGDGVLRIAVLVLLVLFAGSAGARETGLPVPPIPPAHPPEGVAPVPDLNVRIPDIDAGRSIVTLDTDINHRADPTPGLGFARGAHYQIDNDRRFALPGVMVRLPFP
jgi:hypothetical protein